MEWVSRAIRASSRDSKKMFERKGNWTHLTLGYRTRLCEWQQKHLTTISKAFINRFNNKKRSKSNEQVCLTLHVHILVSIISVHGTTRFSIPTRLPAVRTRQYPPLKYTLPLVSCADQGSPANEQSHGGVGALMIWLGLAVGLIGWNGFGC